MKTRHFAQLIPLRPVGRLFSVPAHRQPLAQPAGAGGLSKGLATLTLAVVMQPLAIAAGLHLASVMAVVPGVLWALPEARFTPAALATLGVLGVITSGLAYWMHLRIIRSVSPVAAMSPAFLIPVFGVTWGHFFLGEAVSRPAFSRAARWSCW